MEQWTTIVKDLLGLYQVANELDLMLKARGSEYGKALIDHKTTQFCTY
jgi:hypothetical protein